MSSRALTRAPASSLWTMATMSFTRGVSASASDPGQCRRLPMRSRQVDRGVRCRPRAHPSHVQEPSVSTDGPSRDTSARRSSPPSTASPAPQTSRPRSTRCCAAAATALGSIDGRGPGAGSRPAGTAARRDPRLRRRRGLAQLAEDVTDPTHPFAEAAVGRSATFDREATMADGTPFVGAYLPLIVSERAASRRSSARWASAGRRRMRSTRRHASCSRRSPRWRRWPSIARGWRQPPPSAPTGSSGWRTRTR